MTPLPDRVEIIEVGPRDGFQNIKRLIPVDVKKQFINFLSAAGLKRIEVSSFVRPDLIPQLADAEDLYFQMRKDPTIEYSFLVPNIKGLKKAINLGIASIAVFTAASEAFNKKNINKTIDESLILFQEICQRALAHKIKVRGYISTAFTCPYQEEINPQKVLEMTQQLLDMGIFEVSIGDTTGKATPHMVENLLSLLLKNFSVDQIAFHAHDTYKMALVNVYKALELGVYKFDSSTGGLGGCPFAPGAKGNVATEDLVHLCEILSIETGVNLQKIHMASDFLKRLTRIDPCIL